jgi:hypothetical protein
MNDNARIDYFRSEIEGKLTKLRADIAEREKYVDTKLADLKATLDRAVRELQRI